MCTIPSNPRTEYGPLSGAPPRSPPECVCPLGWKQWLSAFVWMRFVEGMSEVRARLSTGAEKCSRENIYQSSKPSESNSKPPSSSYLRHVYLIR